MHELSIALSILEMAEEEAERRGARRVIGIHLKLGALSGVDPAALRSAYELASEMSALQGAALVVAEVPVIVHCPRCAADRPVVSATHLCCSVCGTPTPQVVAGRELEVVALEIEP
jgi:hydrogenase nickel incorporation protein HypA/HybF